VLKAKYFVLIILLLSNLNLYLNFKKYESFKLQKILLFDLAENKSSLNINDLPKFIFPNLTVNSIPIKSLYSRYYEASGDIDYSIKLLKEGISDNPYLALTFYLTSRAYINQNDLLKAYNYSYKAYKLSPNIESVNALYIALDQILKDSL